MVTLAGTAPLFGILLLILFCFVVILCWQGDGQTSEEKINQALKGYKAPKPPKKKKRRKDKKRKHHRLAPKNTNTSSNFNDQENEIDELKKQVSEKISIKETSVPEVKPTEVSKEEHPDDLTGFVVVKRKIKRGKNAPSEPNDPVYDTKPKKRKRKSKKKKKRRMRKLPVLKNSSTDPLVEPSVKMPKKIEDPVVISDNGSNQTLEKSIGTEKVKERGEKRNVEQRNSSTKEETKGQKRAKSSEVKDVEKSQDDGAGSGKMKMVEVEPKRKVEKEKVEVRHVEIQGLGDIIIPKNIHVTFGSKNEFPDFGEENKRLKDQPGDENPIGKEKEK